MTKKVERGKCSPLVLFNFLWTHGLVAYQAPLSVGFSRQEYCSGLPCPPPGDLPDPGIDHGSLALQADSWLLSHQGSQRRQSRIYGPFKINCSFFFSFFNGQICECFMRPAKYLLPWIEHVKFNIIYYSIVWALEFRITDLKLCFATSFWEILSKLNILCLVFQNKILRTVRHIL